MLLDALFKCDARTGAKAEDRAGIESAGPYEGMLADVGIGLSGKNRDAKTSKRLARTIHRREKEKARAVADPGLPEVG